MQATEATSRRHTMDVTFTDVNRALCDSRTIGEASKSYPLQASLSNLAVVSGEGQDVACAVEMQFKEFLDGCVGSVKNGIDDAEKESDGADAAKQVAQKVRAALLLRERGVGNTKSQYPSNLIEGFEMASEITFISTLNNRVEGDGRGGGVPPPQAPQSDLPLTLPLPPAQMKSQSLTSGMPPRTDQRENIGNNKEKVSSRKTGRGDQTDKLPFTTGRDIYVKDGGQFDPETSKKRVASGGGTAAEFASKRAFGGRQQAAGGSSGGGGKAPGDDYELPQELEGCDKALVQKIESEILHRGQQVKFSDIAGLKHAKDCVNETICWPIKNPQMFTGLRKASKGVLLFGPPGTGKTLIGKAIAHESGATFFAISASSLMSKWIGEGEKTVRTLFAVAAYRQPAVVFLDEVDSLLTQRSSDENEATRRIKTEFLVQLDGAGSDQDAQVVIVGATNRPEELDEAARRRFVKRLYVPLPGLEGRLQLLRSLLHKDRNMCALSDAEMGALAEQTKGFSGADIQALCQDAAMGPIRDITERYGQVDGIQAGQVPAIELRHFQTAQRTVKASVSPDELQRYLNWNSQYGSDQNIEEPS